MNAARRIYLSVTLKLLVLVAVGVASVPFITSLRGGDPSSGALPDSTGNPWNREADLSALAAGGIQRLDWPGGEVWIYHRLPGEAAQLIRSTDTVLRDPQSRLSRQPPAAHNALRSLQRDYFVFLPRESIRGCQVSQGRLPDGHPGFQEPCYGARYDSAGRILRDSGRVEQRNLDVPPHEFLSPRHLRMLEKK